MKRRKDAFAKTAGRFCAEPPGPRTRAELHVRPISGLSRRSMR